MCLVVYGMGVSRLGTYGAYTAYPMFLGAMILTGNLVGVLRGEWRGTSMVTRTVMAGGILVLAAAFVVLARLTTGWVRETIGQVSSYPHLLAASSAAPVQAAVAPKPPAKPKDKCKFSVGKSAGLLEFRETPG